MVKYLQDKKTGKLAGSIGVGKLRTPTIVTLPVPTSHTTVNGAPSPEETYNKFKNNPTTKTPEPVAQAFAFNPENIPNYPKPAWFTQLEKSSAENPLLPSNTELVDIIPSPIGDLAVVWQNQIQDDKMVLDSGYDLNVLYYKTLDSGKTVGYIKLSSQTEEAYARSFGTDEFSPFRFDDRYGGSSYQGLGFDGYDKRKSGDKTPQTVEELETVRKTVWATASKNQGKSLTRADGTYVPYYNLQPTDAPTGEKLVTALQELSKPIKEKIAHNRAYFNPQHPYVDYSSLDKGTREETEALKGKGYGSALYIYAAKILGTQGKILRGSSLQSDNAQGVWHRFKKTIPQHVSELTLKWGQSTNEFYALDFRKP